MSHSFKEFHSRRKIKNYQKELVELNEEDDDTLVEMKNNPAYSELKGFYEACTIFLEMWEQFSVSRISFCECWLFDEYESEIRYESDYFSDFLEHFLSLLYRLIFWAAQKCKKKSCLAVWLSYHITNTLTNWPLFYKLLWNVTVSNTSMFYHVRAYFDELMLSIVVFELILRQWLKLLDARESFGIDKNGNLEWFVVWTFYKLIFWLFLDIEHCQCVSLRTVNYFPCY